MITQYSLARKLGVSVSTICVYEQGTRPRRLTPASARKFSDLMGNSLKWWLSAEPHEIAAKVRQYRLAQKGV